MPHQTIGKIESLQMFPVAVKLDPRWVVWVVEDDRVNERDRYTMGIGPD